jgi:type VI secretion system protein ImpL
MVRNPRAYSGLLEVCYQCLSLGFEGKSASQSKGLHSLEDTRRKLSAHIRALKGETSRSLSSHWQGAALKRTRRLAALRSWINTLTLFHRQRGSAPGERSSTADLEHRFSNAVARLLKHGADGRRIRSLPWWFVVGTPGSGKTTVVERSELSFVVVPAPDETRSCNWWFTDDAALLDIPGQVDWNQLLPFLKFHRRQIQGALITHSASDLLKQGTESRDVLLRESRQRLLELNSTLGRSLPVYLLMTKMDVILGFREYFADLDATDRNQVWGVTFALADCRSGRAVNTLPAEFDVLVGRLHDGLAQRLRDEPDLRRRSVLFEFPQQMAALKPGLIDLVNKIDHAPGTGLRSSLRGVYLTSGGGPGNSMDAVGGSVNSPPVPADARSARTFFIGQLLRDVVLREAEVSL